MRTGFGSVRKAAERSLSFWSGLRPPQQLVLGFGLYVLVGLALLSLPCSQAVACRPLDNLFNAVSAVSTTGLTSISVADSYTWLGEAVILALFQVGGIGYMTVSSVLILATGRPLSPSRLGVLKAGFSVPHYFVMPHFLVQVAVFTLIAEALGAGVLWWRFSVLGVENALWSAVFHSVSCFTTAGFSLNNSSLEGFASDWVVNLTAGALCYLGAIGFIVVQDVWYSAKLRERMLTFTSKVILWSTLAVLVAGTPALMVLEPSVERLPFWERLLACSFQVMTASTTAGFNTIPIGALSPATICVLLLAMLVGASPSGTGGGLKTTTVSAIIANMLGVLRGRSAATFLGHEIPPVRVTSAFASASLYLIGTAVGVLALCITERHDFLRIVFEAASAIGTVGLSMVSGELSDAGKVVVIVLMFAGRCGPLTLGLCLLGPSKVGPTSLDDLAV